MKRRVAALLCGLAAALAMSGAVAGEKLPVLVCHGYGCAFDEAVWYDSDLLDELGERLGQADSAPAERALLAGVIGAMYRVAGEQTLVSADRGGNFADAEMDGRMDCIDHSTSTTRLLRLLEARGALRFHRVLEPVRRTRVLFQHFSAAIEETDFVPPAAVPVPAAVPDYLPVMLAQCDCAEVLGDMVAPAPPPPAATPEVGAQYVVDSWFVDNGEPAVVLPLAAWLDGEGPNVQ